MIKQKGAIVRRVVIGMFVLFAVMLSGKQVQAANYSISADEQWRDGTIAAEGQRDYYELILKKGGRLTIDYQTLGLSDSYASLHDKDMMTRYDWCNPGNSSETKPEARTMKKDLEPGTYKIVVYGIGTRTGTYRLRASFTAANNTEKEPNDGFESAQPLLSGTKYRELGFLSCDDRLDYYKINVPDRQEIKITCTFMMRSQLKLWDDSYKALEWFTKEGSEENPNKFELKKTLDPGTYYIGLQAEGERTGRYYLMWEEENPSLPVSKIYLPSTETMEIGERLRLTAVVLPESAANKSVKWSSGNTAVAAVDGNGSVRAKSAGVTDITAAAADGSGVKAVCRVTVKAADIKAGSVKISGNKRVAAGTSFQLKETVSPSNTTNKAVSWTSSNKSVAVVSSSGKVTTKSPGKAVITAKAKDGSGKAASVSVIVLPQKMNLISVVSAREKRLKISWKKQSAVSGYRIQWSTDKNFKNVKSAMVAKNYSSLIRTNLTSKKRYYVRVRSYIQIGNRRYYGAWSKVKYRIVR